MLLDKLKYISFLKKLAPYVNQALADPFSSKVELTYVNGEDDHAVKVSYESAFPPASIEFTEGLPKLNELEGIERRFGNAIGHTIIAKLRSIKRTDVEYTVILVDGNNLAHRARHVYKLSHLGQDTSILYGVLRSLAGYYKRFKPYRIVVCFDHGYPASRKQLVPTYKAGRAEAHAEDIEWIEALRQLNKLYEWLPKFGIMTCKIEGYEADDLIAAYSSTVPNLFQGDHQRVLVVSGDKDMYQLVNHSVDVCDPNSNLADRFVTVESFEQFVGVPQHSYLLYRALVGDDSDKIPGVKGIGPGKAKKLLATWPTVGELHLAYIRKKLPETEHSLIADAGGLQGSIYPTLNCINLAHNQPTFEQLSAGSLIPPVVEFKWRDIETELIQLGFVSLANDDNFREMVKIFNQHHGLVG